jgi:hypothetical protein
MTNTIQSRRYAIGLTALSAVGRVVPHAPNFTPLGASCLFAGSRISGWLAYVLPLAVMLATDPFVGGYTRTSPFIYLAFMINVWIGRRIVSQPTAMRMGAAAFLCSLQFFLISNFAVWFSGILRGSSYYSHDLAGLLTCYTAAIPFFGRTLGGDLLFSALLFSAWSLLPRLAVTARAANA